MDIDEQVNLLQRLGAPTPVSDAVMRALGAPVPEAYRATLRAIGIDTSRAIFR